MKESEATKWKAETGMVPCWLVWEAASDGGRPYLIAVDTSEEQANLHVRSKREEARLHDRPPPQIRVEESWLDHLYGESMTKTFDEAKKMMKDILRAQIADLKKKLHCAVDLARDVVEHSRLLARRRDEVLDELAKLEKAL